MTYDPKAAPAADFSAVIPGEGLYRQFFHEHGDAMYVVDVGAETIVEANAAACTFYGYAPGCMVGEAVFTVCPPPGDGAPPCLCVGPAPEGATGTDVVSRHSPALGERIVSRRITRLQLEGRAYSCIVETDITERVKAETALRESEQKFSAAFHHGPTAFAISTSDMGRYLDVNENWLGIYGFDRDEVVGSGVVSLGIWTPQQREVFLEALEEQGRLASMEFPFTRKGGETGTGLIFAERMEIMGKGCILSAVIDITGRFEAEKRLLAREARYKAIVEDQTELICRRLPDGRLSFVNKAYARYYGMSRRECLERNFAPDIPETDAERIRNMVAGLTPERPTTAYEHRVRLSGGGFRRQQWTHRAIFNAVGEVVEHQTVGKDVSEQRQAEEALALLNKQLEAKVSDRTKELKAKADELERVVEELQELDRMKSIFLSSVSHELRTPLTSMLGFSKLIDKEFSKKFEPLAAKDVRLKSAAQRIRNNLGIIGSEGERLTRLVNDVLDLARIEDGRMQWRESTFTLREMAEKAADSVRPIFTLKGDVAFRVQVDAPLVRIRGDFDRLQQVWINLLQNAARFTERGEVRLAVSTAAGGGVRVMVSDTGPGIPVQELESVFDKFFQARKDDTMARKNHGAGLGLAICKNIVEHFGGSIRVKSTLGKGATFTVELPENLIVRDD